MENEKVSSKPVSGDFEDEREESVITLPVKRNQRNRRSQVKKKKRASNLLTYHDHNFFFFFWLLFDFPMFFLSNVFLLFYFLF
jgi:hypothetical protein